MVKDHSQSNETSDIKDHYQSHGYEVTSEDDYEDEKENHLDPDKNKVKGTKFHLDSAIGQFNQKLYEELDKTESGNIIFSPFRSDI